MVALAARGQRSPTWPELANGLRPPQLVDEDSLEFGDYLRGWQRIASSPGEHQAFDGLLERLDEPSRALLLSQGGTFGSRALTVFPTLPELRLTNSQFRVLLLRRLRLPLPFTSRRCSCRCFLDPFGDHRAACPRAGVLGPRGAPLERVLARACREAGARVAWNVFLRYLNLDDLVTDKPSHRGCCQRAFSVARGATSS